MHLMNHYFGHSKVLAEYAGIAEPLPIWGALQHGWNDTTGFGDHLPPRVFRLFVWSERNLAHLPRGRRQRALAIGAPYLYLLKSQPPPGPPGDRSTIVYPIHGWEREEAAGGSHVAYADAIAEREDGPVTVCLFFTDFAQRHIREPYERAGFRIICHGSRESPTLLRQLSEIGRHDRVVSNRVTTAVWYGAIARRETEIYGPPMGAGAGLERKVRDHRSRWPELHAGPVQPELGAEMAAPELGTSNILAPEALRAALGWDRQRPGLAQPVARTIHASMWLKRRIEGW